MKGGRLFFALVASFVVMVSLAYLMLFEHGWFENPGYESRPRAPERIQVAVVDDMEPISNASLSVVKLEGKVEIMQADGAWKPAKQGELLESHDKIRTGSAAKAWLEMPEFFSVVVDAGSEFEIGLLAKGVVKFLLEKGMIFAEVMDDPNRLFEIKASTTTARTKGASFQMMTNRNGNVSLGTTRGMVEVEETGKIIEVDEGYLTRIVRGKGPQDPIKIPTGMLLKVHWPEETKFSQPNLEITGQTSPGARVRINNVLVLVNAKGEFKKNIRLREGSNRIQVESYDLGGKSKTTQSPNFFLDTKPESFRIETSPEMWKKSQKPTPSE